MKTLLDINYNKRNRNYPLLLKQKRIDIFNKFTFCIFANEGGAFLRFTNLFFSVSFGSSSVCGITWHFDAALYKDKRILIF